MSDWFLLVYKIPPEPSRYRAAVWRKLKASGAIYLQSSVAVLPADAASERLMRGLVQDIRDMQGAAYLVRGTPLTDETEIVAAFQAAREAEYRELLDRCAAFHDELARERAAAKLTFAELEETEDDLHKLEAWLGKIRTRDRFAHPRRTEAEAAITACHEDLDAFAAAVYTASGQGEVSETSEVQAIRPASPHIPDTGQ